MSSLYESAVAPVRNDLAQAHLAIISGWASPGNWWSAAERLAMVDEVRRARSTEKLPPWVRPTTVDGLTDGDSPLPASAIDAVWRLTNHSGTLTAEWYQETIDAGLSPEQYVELVGVVATANCIEVFAATVGVGPLPLPVPAEGEPDRAVVADTAVSSHWVPTAPIKGPNVGKALTAVPVAAEAWITLSNAQYVQMGKVIDVTWDRGTLDRMQIELLAARTSLLNECFY